jgi:hypothetical protein
MIANCCCDFIAITHIAEIAGLGGSVVQATFRLIGTAEVAFNGGLMKTKRWPCWTVPYYQPGVITDYAGDAIPSIMSVLKPAATVMGFRPAPYALVFAGAGAVKRLLPRECSLVAGVFLAGGGFSTVDTIIDATASATLFASTIPAGSWDSSAVFWSSASDDRLFGYTTCSRASDGEAHFIQWSVDDTGGDYTVILDLATMDYVPAGSAVNVCNGRAFAVVSDSKIYEDGTLVATVSNSGIANAAVAWIGGQRLLLTPSVLGATADSALFILLDGSDVRDTPVLFRLALAGGIYTEFYRPLSMAWDPIQKAIAVTWAFLETDPSSFGTHTPVWPWGYTTYITEPIVTGNIAGQDGVRIYANFPSGYGNTSNESTFWATVINGLPPVPLKLEAGIIEPPPTPDVPVCDSFAACIDRAIAISSYFTFFMFVNCTQALSDSLGDYTETVYWENVEGPFNFTSVASATSPCSGATSSSTLLFFLATGTPGNYADPGILWKSRAYDDFPEHHDETYVTGIYVQVECRGEWPAVDAGVHITRVMFETQRWVWIDPNPPISHFEACEVFDADPLSLAVAGGTARDCAGGIVPWDGTLISHMDFDYCGDSSLHFAVVSGLVT